MAQHDIRLFDPFAHLFSPFLKIAMTSLMLVSYIREQISSLKFPTIMHD